jgi:hypothetical protein
MRPALADYPVGRMVACGARLALAWVVAVTAACTGQASRTTTVERIGWWISDEGPGHVVVDTLHGVTWRWPSRFVAKQAGPGVAAESIGVGLRRVDQRSRSRETRSEFQASLVVKDVVLSSSRDRIWVRAAAHPDEHADIVHLVDLEHDASLRSIRIPLQSDPSIYRLERFDPDGLTFWEVSVDDSIAIVTRTDTSGHRDSARVDVRRLLGAGYNRVTLVVAPAGVIGVLAVDRVSGVVGGDQYSRVDTNRGTSWADAYRNALLSSQIAVLVAEKGGMRVAATLGAFDFAPTHAGIWLVEPDRRGIGFWPLQTRPSLAMRMPLADHVVDRIVSCGDSTLWVFTDKWSNLRHVTLEPTGNTYATGPAALANPGQVASVQVKPIDAWSPFFCPDRGRHLWISPPNGMPYVATASGDSLHVTPVTLGSDVHADPHAGVWGGDATHVLVGRHAPTRLVQLDIDGRVVRDLTQWLGDTNAYVGAAYVDRGRIWIRTNAQHGYGRAVSLPADGAPTRDPQPVELTVGGEWRTIPDDDRLWFLNVSPFAATPLFLARPAPDLVAVSVGDQAPLTLGSRPGDTLTLSPPNTIAFSVVFPGTQRPPRGVRVDLALLDARDTVAWAGDSLTRDTTLLRSRAGGLHDGDQYSVVLRYRDERGSDLTFRWPRVTVRTVGTAWWDRPRQRTVAIYLVVLALTVVAVHAAPSGRSLVTLIPAALWLLTLLSSAAAGGWLDTRLLGALLLASVVVAAAAGLVSPLIFRALARTEPFARFVPPLLRIRGVRRRLFADYAAAVARGLATARANANQEQYLALPARVSYRRPAHPLAGVATLEIHDVVDDMPAERLAALLAAPVEPVRRMDTHTRTAGEVRAHVILSAVGGRGKSALLRETVQLLLERFDREPAGPLPVLCDAAARDAFDAVRSALGAYVISEEALRSQLALGDFVLVIDRFGEGSGGIQEAVLALDRLLRSAGDGTTCLLAARPAASSALASAPGLLAEARLVVTAEPLSLTSDASSLSGDLQSCGPPSSGSTLNRFIESYTGRPDAIPGTLLSACRTQENTYSPILVRLAAKVALSGAHGATDRSAGGTPSASNLSGHQGPALDAAWTVADLYACAFEQLTGVHTPEAGARDLAAAGDLCVRTYFRTGVRAIALPGTGDDRVTIKRLLDAGLLVPADGGARRLASEPSQVRFVHDSMQSFVTARGLFDAGHWDELQRAAGWRPFVDQSAELGLGEASELFQMCRYVFRPTEVLREHLDRDLRQWAARHGARLYEDLIARACPSSVKQAILERVGNDASGRAWLGEVLREARRLRDEGAVDTALDLLGRVYAAVAPIAYTDNGAS